MCIRGVCVGGGSVLLTKHFVRSTVRVKKSLHFVMVIRIVLRSDYQAYCGKITLCIALRITDHWVA